MPKCTIDGRELEFSVGENLVDIAARNGIEIPVYCYHPALTVVAQCRMCMVEIEKMPKLQTACSTKASEGMVVKTTSENVIKARQSVMEFLLVNHPLDCPICDKAGECDLQDFSYRYGNAYMRSTENRRTYLDLDMGPVIQKNMNRCIHCTRCIRFGDEVAGIREMVAVKRGNNTEITTLDGRALETDYAGNYADICPTGSLTLKDFRFQKRAWMLKKTSSICDGCSRGCNLEHHHHNNIVYRSVPKANESINKYWLCDEGRFRFLDIQEANSENSRIIEPKIRESGKLVSSTTEKVLAAFKSDSKGKKGLLLVGTDLTTEEMQIVLDFKANQLQSSEVRHFGVQGILEPSQDQAADKILKRTNKTANLNGAHKLGIKGFDGKFSGFDFVVVFKTSRANVLPFNFSGIKAYGFGALTAKEADLFQATIPGLNAFEKSGTYFNFENKEQKVHAAVQAPWGVLSLAQFVAQASGGNQ